MLSVIDPQLKFFQSLQEVQANRSLNVSNDWINKIIGTYLGGGFRDNRALVFDVLKRIGINKITPEGLMQQSQIYKQYNQIKPQKITVLCIYAAASLGHPGALYELAEMLRPQPSNTFEWLYENWEVAFKLFLSPQLDNFKGISETRYNIWLQLDHHIWKNQNQSGLERFLSYYVQLIQKDKSAVKLFEVLEDPIKIEAIRIAYQASVDLGKQLLKSIPKKLASQNQAKLAAFQKQMLVKEDVTQGAMQIILTTPAAATSALLNKIIQKVEETKSLDSNKAQIFDLLKEREFPKQITSGELMKIADSCKDQDFIVEVQHVIFLCTYGAASLGEPVALRKLAEWLSPLSEATFAWLMENYTVALNLFLSSLLDNDGTVQFERYRLIEHGTMNGKKSKENSLLYLVHALNQEDPRALGAFDTLAMAHKVEVITIAYQNSFISLAEALIKLTESLPAASQRALGALKQGITLFKKRVPNLVTALNDDRSGASAAFEKLSNKEKITVIKEAYHRNLPTLGDNLLPKVTNELSNIERDDIWLCREMSKKDLSVTAVSSAYAISSIRISMLGKWTSPDPEQKHPEDEFDAIPSHRIKKNLSP